MPQNIYRAITTLILLLFMGGCAHHGYYERHEANQFVTEFYAWVDDVKTVQFDSKIGENMIVGAAHGAFSWGYYDPHDSLQGAIWGGLLAGFVTAIVEGDSTGYEYQLSAVDGDFVTVLSDTRSAVLGDCVRVRVADEVRMYPVAAENCIADVM